MPRAKTRFVGFELNDNADEAGLKTDGRSPKILVAVTVAGRGPPGYKGLMWKYLQLHEAFVRRALAESHDPLFWEGLATFHAKQLAYLQHERLMHLLVMLTVALLCLLSFGFVSVVPSLPAFGVAALLLVLVLAYVVHSFRLENGVQRWYHLANRLDEKRGVVHARFDEEHP